MTIPGQTPSNQLDAQELTDESLEEVSGGTTANYPYTAPHSELASAATPFPVNPLT